jgi:hypothetical protein
MKQIELRLRPAPGAKPEFLAKLQPTDTNANAIWETVPPLVVLEGYTRDAWASDTSTQWQSLQVTSVDGRQKLPGFLKHLRDRKKTAFGSFRNSSSGQKYMWVVSYKQASSQMLTCRIAPVEMIPDCPVKGNANANAKPVQATPPAAASKPSVAAVPPRAAGATTTTTKPIRKKGFGLLGNLVGAQKRTNQHLHSIRKPQPAAPTATTTTDAADAATATDAATSSTTSTIELKTSGQVLAEFRQEMEQQMLDFDLSSEPMLQVKIDLATKLKLLSDQEQQQGRVTMEILKYIVYEQAEEVNDEWIAQKQASEFLDEVVIAIYKQGQAPPEVMEDVLKGDLPDEIKGQQRAMQQQQQKSEQQRSQKNSEAQQKAALKDHEEAQQGEDGEDQLAALNQNKRDRRTIEEIQTRKRQRGE